jgi:transcriptional regulator with XRE-family HTH domain
MGRRPRETPPPAEAGRIAVRLDHLFRTMHPVTGPYTNGYVAEKITEASGQLMSGGYLSRLRAGERRNPSRDKMAAIAAFFNVPIAYFYDDDFAALVDEQLDVLAAARDSGIKEIAARTNRLSEEQARSAFLAVAEMTGIKSMGEKAQDADSS